MRSSFNQQNHDLKTSIVWMGREYKDAKAEQDKAVIKATEALSDFDVCLNGVMSGSSGLTTEQKSILGEKFKDVQHGYLKVIVNYRNKDHAVSNFLTNVDVASSCVGKKFNVRDAIAEFVDNYKMCMERIMTVIEDFDNELQTLVTDMSFHVFEHDGMTSDAFEQFDERFDSLQESFQNLICFIPDRDYSVRSILTNVRKKLRLSDECMI